MFQGQREGEGEREEEGDEKVERGREGGVGMRK